MYTFVCIVGIVMVVILTSILYMELTDKRK